VIEARSASESLDLVAYSPMSSSMPQRAGLR
jgi:hypothetical protein